MTKTEKQIDHHLEIIDAQTKQKSSIPYPGMMTKPSAMDSVEKVIEYGKNSVEHKKGIKKFNQQREIADKKIGIAKKHIAEIIGEGGYDIWFPIGKKAVKVTLIDDAIKIQIGIWDNSLVGIEEKLK